MAKKLKNIESFDQHTKKYSLSDIMSMLPTNKEAEAYVNGSYGYSENDEDWKVISASEEAFVSGCDWVRNIVLSKLNK
jgi:hypothetical protein